MMRRNNYLICLDKRRKVLNENIVALIMFLRLIFFSMRKIGSRLGRGFYGTI